MHIDLFSPTSGNELYNQLKRDDVIWHKSAREYWNQKYNQYKHLLDGSFPTKFPKEFLNCLWELKLACYLDSVKDGSLVPSLKDKIKIPDFKWIVNGEIFFFEAVCPTKGDSKKYPYLNTKLPNTPIVRDSTAGHREYRERITGAFREKAICNYDPSNCNPKICKHKHSSGYKTSINDNGYIIAISMCDVDFFNQAMNWRIDLSCFFPISPYMTMDIDQSGKVLDTYHAFSPSFVKGNKQGSAINVNIFCTNEFSHVSAVIISRHWPVLFPKLSQHQLLNYDAHDNDFMLIHNPFATKKIQLGVLPVERELIAEINGDTCTIQTINTISANM